MIAELRVRDLATIADVTLELGPGLNVLTGETGAGKSMIVDALALLLGARADSSVIRPGATRAVVEGAFEDLPPALVRHLDDLGFEADEGRLVVRREVAAEGRSRAWLNGSPVTVGGLASIGRFLVDLHGQHETQSLLRADAQRDILDAFADAERERRVVAGAYADVTRRAGDLDALETRRDEVRRRADYLRHVVKEIGDARPEPGEDERLETEARRLVHAEELSALAETVVAATDGGEDDARTALARAAKALVQLERVDSETSAWRAWLDAVYANLDELAAAARAYAGLIEQDPSRLSAIEARRDLLYRLQQKYGPSIGDVVATRDRASQELDLLDTADHDLGNMARELADARERLARAAMSLSEARRRGAETLAREVDRLLGPLGLPSGRFHVQLDPEAEIRAHGGERVTFEVRLNPGLPSRPLARVASGGELSRLMLALKVVLVRHDRLPTLVFDEVDQGIGGEVGAQVGEALARVAAGRQVLVITHLPQIAARAASHLAVAKRAKGGVATSDVTTLAGAARVTELARMLGDADGTTARRHAEELLKAGAAAPPARAGRTARSGIAR